MRSDLLIVPNTKRMEQVIDLTLRFQPLTPARSFQLGVILTQLHIVWKGVEGEGLTEGGLHLSSYEEVIVHTWGGAFG